MRILVNGTTQFIREGQGLAMDLHWLELVELVHVTKLAVHGVIYQMCGPVKETKTIEHDAVPISFGVTRYRVFN